MISPLPNSVPPKPVSLWQLAGIPQVCALQPLPDPANVFQRLCHLPGCVFLDSSLVHSSLGRYSFIAADPFETICVEVGTVDPLSALQQRLDAFPAARRQDLPPFQGGAIGIFGYELGNSFEHLPRAMHDEFQIPAIHVGLYDVVVSFDHLTKNAWIISHGWPEVEPTRRAARANQRLKMFHDRLTSQKLPRSRFESADKPGGEPMRIDTPHHPVPGAPRLFSNFTKSGYLQAVEHAIEYIRAGDIFQANLSQRLLMQATSTPPAVFKALRKSTRSTFAAYYDGGEFQVVSASPERFLRIDNRHVESRPIKGTRRVTHDALRDAAVAKELQENEKERAENIMIVDLLRNDLSRVCAADSIQVPQLCQVESYGYVQHLVSSVTGILAEGQHALDALRSAFPGGSVTGAPKKRAMEILVELERVARGAYCGSLGYIGWDGSLDLNILIRTITCKNGWWQFPVGGAVTAQSDPAAEYFETWDKAAGLLQALDQCRQLDSADAD